MKLLEKETPPWRWSFFVFDDNVSSARVIFGRKWY